MGLLWLLIVGLVVWLVVQQRQGAAPAGRPGESRALEILRQRYARGEITREQFEQMRRDLQ